MATEVKRRRGTTAEHSTFIGAVAEVTVDLTKDTLVVHDGSTTGGFPLLRDDASNATNLSTFRTNIGLTNASADLDLNSVDIGGSAFVDSNRNVSAGTGSFSGNVSFQEDIKLPHSGSNGFEIDVFQNKMFLGRDTSASTNWVAVFDELNTRVGIGTTSPSETLDVNGSIAINGSTFVDSSRNIFGTTLDFASTTGDKIALYGDIGDANGYGIGIESSTFYYKSGDRYRWYSGSNADGGTSSIMTLSNGGNLTVTKFTAEQSSLIGTSATFPDNRGGLSIAVASDPSVFLEKTGNPTDEKKWGFRMSGTSYILETVSDDNSTTETAVRVVRGTGTAVSSVDVQTHLDANSTANFQGDITTQANIADDGFSDWFSVNPSGYEIDGPNGIADFRTVFTDELIAKAFTADVAQALAGSDFLTKSVAKLAENFTIPAVSASGTMVLEDLEGLDDLQVFESGDWIRIRIVDTTSSPAVIGDVYGTVSSYVDNADGTQDWTFTVDYAGASDVLVGQTVYKGAIVLDYGVSGDTFIERSVLDRSSGTDFTKVPYDRIVRWTNTGSGSPRPGDPDYSAEVLTQTGNINGLGGFSSPTFGFYAKDNFVVELDGSNMKFGKDVGASNEDGIFLDSDDYWFSDGTGSVGNGILNWDASIPEVNISAFTANTTEIKSDLGAGFIQIKNDGSLSRFFVTPDGTSNNLAALFWNDSNGEWGIQGRVSGSDLFRLGDTNQIAGIDFDDSALSTGDGSIGSYTAGTVTGLQKRTSSTTRTFFSGADDNNGTNANFYVLANGEIFYDGLGKTIYRGQNVAGFAANASASSLTNDEWEQESSVNTDGSGNGSDSDTATKIRVRWKKRFGINSITLNLRYRAVFTTDGDPGASSTAQIVFRVSDTEDDSTPLAEDTTGITVNTSLTEDNLTLDVSSLTDDDTFFVEIEMSTSVTASGATPSTTYRQELFMREDVEIIETT